MAKGDTKSGKRKAFEEEDDDSFEEDLDTRLRKNVAVRGNSKNTGAKKPRTTKARHHLNDGDNGGSDSEPRKRKDAKSSKAGASVVQDFEAIKRKFEAFKKSQEEETRRLVEEAKQLARDEKKTYEKLVGRLKSEITALSAQSQQQAREHKQKMEDLATEHTLRLESLKRERQDLLDTNERLRRQAHAPDGKQTPVPYSADAAATGVHTGSLAVELNQAKKLLELYRLVTSTEIRLIEAMEEDDDVEVEACTDVACAVVDSVTGKRFLFDLAIPHDAHEEVEYVPTDDAASDLKAPSYLQEELSFKRRELTKFMRTLLDVVVRKQPADENGGRTDR